MKIIPAIDLKDGLVVRGVAGRRSEYQAIRSVLADDARPSSIAAGLARAFSVSVTDAYVADLDAIAGAAPDGSAYRQIAAAGFQLWIDAGISSPKRARDLLRIADDLPAPAHIVAGLESLDSPAMLATVADVVAPRRTVFSLDLKFGSPLTRSPRWQGISAMAIVKQAISLGIEAVIVLDLAQVGLRQGVGTATKTLCRQIRDQHPDVTIVSGGGVRGPGDVQALARAGCDAVLVASALHDGLLPIV